MKNNKATSKSFYKVVLTIFIICNFFLIKNIINGLHEKFNIAIIVFGFSIFIPLFINIRKKNFFLFEPKNIIPLWFSGMYYISSIPIYSVKYPREFFRTLLFNPLDKDNITIFYILSLGILLFYIGYGLVSILLSKRRKINYSISLTEIIKYKTTIFRIYLFSVSFRVFGYLSGFMGSLSASNGANNNLPNIPFISVFFFIANSWVIYFFYYASISFSSKKNRNIFLFFLFFEFIFMLLSGHRRYLVVILFLYALAFYIVNNYLPIGKTLKYVIPFLIFVFPFITIYGYLLPTLDNYGFISLLDLLSSTLSRLTSISFLDILNDYLLGPILESFNYFSNVGIAYTEFTQKGIAWGAVGPENLLNKLIPSFIYPSSFDERVYYQIFSETAMSYRVDYSNLTFTAQSEQMLSFGITGVLFGMFLQGVVSSFLFRIFNSVKTPFFLRLVYLGLLFKFSINFCSGLLVSDLVLAFRLLFYAIIVYFFYKIFTRNYA